MPLPSNFGNFNALGSSSGGGGSAGHTAFGTVPGPIATPPNIFSQVNQAVPGFGGLTQGTSNVIGSELSGQVSPATLKAMQNAAATFGVTSGMPGSGLQQNGLFGNIAGFSENRQRQGLQDYLGTLGTVGHTMTDPGLAAEIASRNSNMAAAPDPQKAAERQLQEWLMKFGLANQLGGYGPGGGTGAFRSGRPPDAPSFGGYGGGRDALGFPLTDMSGGAMGNAYYGGNGPVGYGPQDSGTQHFAAGAGGSLNPAFTGTSIPSANGGRSYFGPNPQINNNPWDPNQLEDAGYFPQDITDYYGGGNLGE